MTRGEDRRNAARWPEPGMKESGQCEEQSGSIAALMAPTPSPALARQPAEGRYSSSGRGWLPGNDFGPQQKTPQRSGCLTRETPVYPRVPSAIRAGPCFQTVERDFSTWPSGTGKGLCAGREVPPGPGARGPDTRVHHTRVLCVSAGTKLQADGLSPNSDHICAG